jgi:hypothetical protein
MFQNQTMTVQEVAARSVGTICITTTLTRSGPRGRRSARDWKYYWLIAMTQRKFDVSYDEKIEVLERRLEMLERQPATFLTSHEVAYLTGRRSKALQVETLRKMGLPFFLNAARSPIVARTAVEGPRAYVPPPKKTWCPPD